MYETRGRSHTRSAGTAGLFVVLVIGAALTLIGQFVLDAAADTSDAWHWIQHGALFAGGAAVGAAAALLYRAGRPLG